MGGAAISDIIHNQGKSLIDYVNDPNIIGFNAFYSFLPSGLATKPQQRNLTIDMLLQVIDSAEKNFRKEDVFTTAEVDNECV